MLTRIKSNEVYRVQQALKSNPGRNVRVSALLKAYGTGLSFFNVWHDHFDTVLARLENSFFLCAGEAADYEEIAFFLKFNPYFHRLTGDAEAVLKTAESFPGVLEQLRYDYMVCTKGKMETAQAEIDSSPRLEDVYSVMSSAASDDFTVGDFAPWYTDVSHRIRHGCARALLIKNDSTPASVCLVSAESDGAGMISGVATRPEYRGQGLASLVVKRASLELAGCSKLPVLECLPKLTAYYAGLGFERQGETVTVVYSQTDK